MNAREQRLAENELIFREVNERVRAIATAHGADEHVYEFYCECSNADCTFHIEATLADYESVRARPTRFLVSPAHALPEIERVVDRRERWWVVEKIGEAAELAEERDPRDD
ncbi:MAG TPA: hypothetical protein VM184_07830 [Gaiellaceae bacterium]|nr:hypothetical protein [Gaiellaceae bacterium]